MNKDYEQDRRDEQHNQLLMLTAALFAVRLFRRKDDDPALDSNVGWSPDNVADAKLLETELREESAERAALDAAAIIAAVAKVEAQ